MTISVELATSIAEAAAKKAVDKALLSLGVDLEKPLEAQQDFAFLRNQRQASETISKTIKVALILAMVSGAISLLVIGFKFSIK